MFTINLEDGREAPSKAGICIFIYMNEDIYYIDIFHTENS